MSDLLTCSLRIEDSDLCAFYGSFPPILGGVLGESKRLHRTILCADDQCLSALYQSP